MGKGKKKNHKPKSNKNQPIPLATFIKDVQHVVPSARTSLPPSHWSSPPSPPQTEKETATNARDVENAEEKTSEHLSREEPPRKSTKSTEETIETKHDLETEFIKKQEPVVASRNGSKDKECEGASSNDALWNDEKNREPNVRIERTHYTRNSNRYSGKSSPDEFDKFYTYLRQCNPRNYTKVTERTGDLFDMDKEYSLAHCVAEDMSMGSGIAIRFSQEFKCRGELYDQRQRQGGLAVLEPSDGRYIYYLVTKKYSSGKPTMETIFSSLQQTQKHVASHGITKLAMPRIGCGLDRLEWSEVKPMIEYVFRETEIEIVVCNIDQPESYGQPPTTTTTTSPRFNKCPVFNVTTPLVDIERLTIIVYLGTEDGHVSKNMQQLEAKFSIVHGYNKAQKKVGGIVHEFKRNGEYLLCCFVVKKCERDPIKFTVFQQCVKELNKLNNSKDCKYEYVGIQAFVDDRDHSIMYKLTNLLRYGLRNVNVYVCWPGDLRQFMPNV